MQRSPERRRLALVWSGFLGAALLTCLATTSCGSSTGQRLYRHGGCVKCHGVKLKGSHLAPSLKGLNERWSPEDLGRFLQNPLGYKEIDPRLKKLAKRYPAPMPVFTMSDADRKQLVAYLLNDSGKQ